MTKRASTDDPETYEPLPAELEAEPFHFHRGMLRELGSCGPYLRKHRELFPPGEYPDGPVINSATCRRHADEFDWGWATSHMLTYRGHDEVERVANSRADRYRPLGRGGSANTRRYAAAFGFVFATHPEYRKETVRDLAARAAENAERLAIEDLEDAETRIAEAREQLGYYAKQLERAEAELPALRANVENVKVRAARAQAAAKERELAAAQRRVAALEVEAAEARRAAAELAESHAASSVPAAAEPTEATT